MSAIGTQFCTLPWQEKDVQHQVGYHRKASSDQHRFKFDRKASVVVIEEIEVDDEVDEEQQSVLEATSIIVVEDIKVEVEPQRVLVRLPDLFCTSFGIVRDAAVNPSYEEVRKESEAWVAEYVYQVNSAMVC